MPDTFILELKLDYTSAEKQGLDRIFSAARTVYNLQLSKIQNRYGELAKTRKYRETMALLSDIHQVILNLESAVSYLKSHKDFFRADRNFKVRFISAEQKKLKNRLKNLYRLENYIHKKRLLMIKNLRVSEYDIQKQLVRYKGQYGKIIPSTVMQKIGTTLNKSVSSTIYKYRPKFRYKRMSQFTSIEGKSNSTGIVFDKDTLSVRIGPAKDRKNPLRAIAVAGRLNAYERSALESRICCCRIVRKDDIRGKSKYYLQLVLKGSLPCKRSVTAAAGRVGIDTGLTTISVCSEHKVMFVKLAKKAAALDQKIIELQSYADRSRRLHNPDKYNEDGSCRKTGTPWKLSGRCQKAIRKMKNLRRVQRVYRKEEHQRLAEEIVTLGSFIFIEPICYKGLARRRTAEDGQTRKGFGRSIGHCAPALLLDLIKRKADRYGIACREINTAKCKASQYRHDTDTFEKAGLDVRVKTIGGRKVQRDLYSAFLIMNVDDTLAHIDKELCDKGFEAFIENQEKEIRRIKDSKEDVSPNFGLKDLL